MAASKKMYKPMNIVEKVEAFKNHEEFKLIDKAAVLLGHVENLVIEYNNSRFTQAPATYSNLSREEEGVLEALNALENAGAALNQVIAHFLRDKVRIVEADELRDVVEKLVEVPTGAIVKRSIKKAV